MRRRHRRSHHRSHSLRGLGEPITLAAIPWLYVVGGALFAKWFAKPKGLTIEQANIIAPVLMERLRSQGTLAVGGGISIEEFIAANPDLLDASLYAGGKAPTKEDLIAEIRAIVEVARAQGAGSYGTYSPLAQTLQGGFGAVLRAPDTCSELEQQQRTLNQRRIASRCVRF